MNKFVLVDLIWLTGLSFSMISCSQINTKKNEISSNILSMEKETIDTIKTATFGNGCFWCTEAIFQQLQGVISVLPGYSGGTVKNPSYKEVCTGNTGHAEVIQIKYDPRKVSFIELLEVFFKTHDPTTLNRQGNDVGTQYRSVVFYYDDEQKALTEEMIQKLNDAQIWNSRIVTQIVPFQAFYVAEEYHQNYYYNNISQPYCRLVITPKIEKFKKIFEDKLSQE